MAQPDDLPAFCAKLVEAFAGWPDGSVTSPHAGDDDVLIAALRDLQWRKRRFVIAIVGTGLVFAMTLVLTGLANGFGVEANRTVDALGLPNYLVKSGAPGPFLGSSPFPATEVQRVSRLPGCRPPCHWSTAAPRCPTAVRPATSTCSAHPSAGPACRC